MHTLHPFFVHFPLALLTLALLFELLAYFTKKPALSQPGWWFQLTGTLGVIAAVLSGVVAESWAGKSLLAVAELFERHEQFGFVSAILFAVLLFFRFSSHQAIPPRWPRAYLLSLTIAVCVLLTTGWLGGELVFSHGIGTPSATP
jgi:uncharacterized membrane protein